MIIKGTAFLARQAVLVDKFGAPAWRAFLQEQSKADPYFSSPILAASKMPVEKFLSINDALVKTFFEGDEKAYWSLGEWSAQWAFDSGPYRNYFTPKDLDKFVALFPKLWGTYYDEGVARGELAGDTVKLFVSLVPYRHVHFEYTIAGFIQRALQLVSLRSVEAKRVRGFSSGDADIQYDFRVG